MLSSIIAYRVQFFLISLSASLIIYQLEPIMYERGIPTSVILTVLSISQFIVIVSNYFWGRFVNRIGRGYILVRIGILIRIIVVLLMCTYVENNAFIALVLMYHTVAGGVDLANEALTLRWTAENEVVFSKIRLFSSFGYSIGG